jgi:hypothetical protein
MIDDPVTRRLRRGLSEARRDYKRARDELRRIQEGAQPNERMAAEAQARPASTSPTAAAAAAPPTSTAPRPDAPVAEVVLHPSVANDRYLALVKQDVEEYIRREFHKSDVNSQTPRNLPPRCPQYLLDPKWNPFMPDSEDPSPDAEGKKTAGPPGNSDAA